MTCAKVSNPKWFHFCHKNQKAWTFSHLDHKLKTKENRNKHLLKQHKKDGVLKRVQKEKKHSMESFDPIYFLLTFMTKNGQFILIISMQLALPVTPGEASFNFLDT